MSDPHTQPEETVTPQDAGAQTSDEALDGAAGGVIDGGCIPTIPILPSPTFPDPGGCFPTFPTTTTWG